MSNSALVDYIKWSPYHAKMSNKKNKKITIHYMAADLSVEACGQAFQTRGGASNYGIDSDGRVGLYVDESNRAYTSNSVANDQQAVTIEVANDIVSGDYHVSDEALAKLIDLCEDICRRNGIKYLNYTGDVDGNMTMHAWFAATGCPGAYLSGKFPYIANEVNKRLGVDFRNSDNVSKYKVGDEVKATSDIKYFNDTKCPSWLQGKTLYIRDVFGKYYDISIYKTGGITGRVHEKYLASLKFEEENDMTEQKNEVPKIPTSDLQIGDVIELVDDAVYTTGKSVPDWVKKSTLYVRSILGDVIGFSIYLEGGITGYTSKQYIVHNDVTESETKDESVEEEATSTFPYNAEVTIVAEKNGFAQIEGGCWIELSKLVKIK